MKIKAQLSIQYDVFDTSNDNELIESTESLMKAILIAEKNKNYAIDLMVDLCDPETGESLTESQDYLFTMQIYPTPYRWGNTDLFPVLSIDKNDKE